MGSPLVVTFAVAVAVAAAAAPIATDEAPTKVRLNKINLLLRSMALHSSTSTSPTSRCLLVPCSSDPHPLQLVFASTSTW